MPESGFYGFPAAQSERARDFRASGKPGATAGADLAGGTTSGAPASGQFLAGDLVVGQDGTLWVCTAAGSPGTFTAATGATGATGAPCQVMPGAWSSGTAYALHDAVGDAGSSYVCILAHTGHEPPNATYWLLVASKGDAGATGAGLIAVNAYAPGSDGLTSSTSTSFVDVDATNQAVTFTAPASGNVLVRVTATIGNTNATWNTFVGLRESTTNLSNTSRITDSSSGTVVLPQSFVYYLTGLASGSHTFKLAFRTENAATAVRLYAGPTWGQTIYEVWAAP